MFSTVVSHEYTVVMDFSPLNVSILFGLTVKVHGRCVVWLSSAPDAVAVLVRTASMAFRRLFVTFAFASMVFVSTVTVFV